MVFQPLDFSGIARDIFDQDHRFAYFSRLDDWIEGQGESRYSRKRNDLRNMFNDVQSYYLADFGRQIRAGKPPNLFFDDWLGSNFDFGNYYRRNVQSRAPESMGRMSAYAHTPRVRHVY